VLFIVSALLLAGMSIQALVVYDHPEQVAAMYFSLALTTTSIKWPYGPKYLELCTDIWVR